MSPCYSATLFPFFCFFLFLLCSFSSFSLVAAILLRFRSSDTAALFTCFARSFLCFKMCFSYDVLLFSTVRHETKTQVLCRHSPQLLKLDRNCLSANHLASNNFLQSRTFSFDVNDNLTFELVELGSASTSSIVLNLKQYSRCQSTGSFAVRSQSLHTHAAVASFR